jgi:hypothetical protein
MTGRTAGTKHIAVGATLALTAGLGWVGAGAASAATPPQASCSLSGQIGFAPGLTMTATNTTAKLSGTLTNCKGKSGVKSGTLNGSVPIGSQTCLSILSPPRNLGTGTMTIKWKGGTSSVVKVTLAVGSNDFSMNGPVTKNRFKGHKFSAPHMKPGGIIPLNFHCQAPAVPITALTYSGPATVS